MRFTTTPKQLLKGLTVGTQTKTHCQWCDHEFYEGDVALVLFTQTADADRWKVHRTYCKTCNPSTIARPVLDRAKLLVRCRLGTPTDVATQPTELVIFEPELIDSSGSVANSRALGINKSTDPDTSAQPLASSSDGVEIETLPLSQSAPATHRSEGDSSVRSEEQPISDDGAD